MVLLQFLFFIIIAIVLFVLAIVGIFMLSAWSTIRSFLGKKPKPADNGNVTHISGGKQRTSTIDKNEGEYVDYEEID